MFSCGNILHENISFDFQNIDIYIEQLIIGLKTVKTAQLVNQIDVSSRIINIWLKSLAAISLIPSHASHAEDLGECLLSLKFVQHVGKWLQISDSLNMGINN